MIVSDLKPFIEAQLLEKYPRTEVESFLNLLCEFKLGMTRVDRMLLKSKDELSSEQQEFFNDAIARLAKEEPIQYIIGQAAFYGDVFYVNPNVIIPRPETEGLVDWIINDYFEIHGQTAHINNVDFGVQQINYVSNKAPSLKILDIGTGSGAIAITLAKKIRNAKVWALDVSAEALEVAKQNAVVKEVDVEWIHQDILKVEQLPQQFDIIVSNPPYVRTVEKTEMQNNVLQYEPPVSLYVSNKTPLLFYDKIADLAKKSLAKNGKLYFEINRSFGQPMLDLMQQKGFKNVALRKDIYGADRMVRGF